MEEYMKKYDELNKIVVYNFELGAGGIGDCIKFFMLTLNYCIQYNYKLYYQLNGIDIEKYLILKYPQMYISKMCINKENSYVIKDINFLKPEMKANIKENKMSIITPFS